MSHFSQSVLLSVWVMCKYTKKEPLLPCAVIFVIGKSSQQAQHNLEERAEWANK